MLLTIFGNANRQAGTYQLGSTPIQTGISRISVVATRDNWPDVGGDLINLVVDISFDAGATWQLLGGFTAPGGVFLDQNGNPITTSGFALSVPQPGNTERRIRATLVCAAQFRTTVTADVT